MVVGGCLEERKHPTFKDKNENPGNLTSTPKEVKEQITSENTSRYAKDKVTRSSWHGFLKKSYLTNLITTCDEMVAFADKMRALDISCIDFNNAFYALPVISSLTN